MTCSESRDLFVDYLTGELEFEQRRRIQRHVNACDRCREALADLSEMWTKLGVLPDEMPSDNLRQRFYGMLETRLEVDGSGYHRKDTPARGVSTGRRFQIPLYPTIRAAALVLVLFLGFAAGRWLPLGNQGRNEVRRMQRDLDSMRSLVMLSLAERSSPSTRLQGVNWSQEIEKPDPRVIQSLLRTLDRDPNVNVRLSALEALNRFSHLPSVRRGLLNSMARQTSPFMQVAVAEQVAQWDQTAARATLDRLGSDPEVPSEVRKLIRSRLESTI